MADEEESLVRRRSRRSTAGNRMEAALAEITAEDPSQDVEDIDFVIEKDEDDVFESDFESTDEEATQEPGEEGDKTVQEDERRQRKAARARVEKAVAGAHVRQKVTFNPQLTTGETPQTPSVENKPKRRVSLGVAIDVETGEVVESSKRRSQRTHTMLNRSATASRLKDAKERRAAIPKKAKVKMRAPTQDELIARALDMEEGNITEHRDYLSLEEEKRKRARVVRASIQGPLLRWISKGEEEVEVGMAPAPVFMPGYHYPGAPGAAASPPVYNIQYNDSFTSTWPLSQQPAMSQLSAPRPSGFASSSNHYSSADPSPSFMPNFYVPPLSAPSVPTERTVKVTKNYVVHELSQTETTPKPGWRETMEAMFGYDVQWEDVRVFVGKGRPLGRRVRTCPITGLPARYLDPRTRVPYANAHAYRILTEILNHDYVWSPSLGCYIGRAGMEHTSAADDFHMQETQV